LFLQSPAASSLQRILYEADQLEEYINVLGGENKYIQCMFKRHSTVSPVTRNFFLQYISQTTP